MVLLKLSRKDFQVDHAACGHWKRRRGFPAEPPAGKHGGMLDGRHTTMPGAPWLGRERKRIGLGPAARENHTLGLAADESRHFCPRRLDESPCRSPLGVN